MKRALAGSIVSLAAVATACGLVIDPDQLIADNGTDAATPGTPADGGVRTDATLGDAEPPTNVPSCVPKAPSGTEGPYAVVSTSFFPTLACPPGYRATPVAKGKSGGQTKSATCGDSSGCTCGSPSGTPACALRVRYFDDLQCEDEKGSPDPVSASCTELADQSYLRVESTVTGLTCAPSGQATPTSKPPVTFSSESWVCEPDPASGGGPCASGEVALPPAANAAACVIRTSGDGCPEPYARTRDLSKDGNVIDDRACACTCPVDGSGTCTGASATLYFDKSCQNATQSVAIGSCRLIAASDGIKGTPGTIGGTPSCTAKASPTGSARPANDLKLCCLR